MPTAVLVANMPPSYIDEAVTESRSSNLVLLRGSGGAADLISEAIYRRRQARYLGNQDGDPVEYKWREASETSTCVLPKSLNEENFVILEAYKDSIEKVVDNVISVVASTSDNEAKEVGSKMFDKTRILEAWKMHVLFSHNASRFGTSASFLFYFSSFVSLLTTLAAILDTQLKLWSDDGVHHVFGIKIPLKLQTALSLTVAILPLITTFLLTCLSRFSPLSKWTMLRAGADQVRSEIYKYRCRADAYGLASGETELEMMISVEAGKVVQTESGNPRKQPVVPEPVMGAAGMKKGAQTEATEKYSSRAMNGRLPRRATLARTLENISNEVMHSDVKLDSLREPPASALSYLFTSLVGQEYKQLQRDYPTGSLPYPRPIENYGPLTGNDELEALEAGFGSSLGTHASERPVDDGFSAMTADDYVTFRLRPILAQQKQMTNRLTMVHAVLQTSLFLSSAANAILGLLGYKLWVSFVVSFVSTLAAIMDYEMLSARVGSLNEAITTLQNVLLWWSSLSMVEKRFPQHMQTLVKTTESVAGADNVWYRKKALRPEDVVAKQEEKQEHTPKGDKTE